MPESSELLVATTVACTRLAPATAREALRTALGDVVGAPALDAVLLAVSELVSNCVRHAALGDGELIDVTVLREGTDLRLEVADGGPGFDWAQATDARQADDASQVSGRGLRIIEHLALQWGVGRAHGKNTVWVRLDSTGKGPHEPDPDRDR